MTSIKLKADLAANAKTLQDVFDIMAKHYDTSTPLRTIAKGQLIANVDKIITVSGAKPKH